MVMASLCGLAHGLSDGLAKYDYRHGDYAEGVYTQVDGDIQADECMQRVYEYQAQHPEDAWPKSDAPPAPPVPKVYVSWVHKIGNSACIRMTNDTIPDDGSFAIYQTQEECESDTIGKTTVVYGIHKTNGKWDNVCSPVLRGQVPKDGSWVTYETADECKSAVAASPY